MKNLFKNLMLVAVAAMAFTACSEDNNEVNNVERVTRYEFTAEIADDTRSGFVEKEDGATAYKSEWAGNETLKIFVTDYNGYYVETTAKIDVEGKFTLELENAPANLFMKVCSPAESWTGENSVNIPAVQNPTALSVDPMAHILATTGFVTVQNGVADKITMAHNDAAYGKMTVNGVDFAIDHVVIDLKGSFYGSSRELSYTINAANVEGNTFWFATEPIDVAEFTVTVYDDKGNAVTKTVDVAAAADKTLAFNYGRVSTFSVKGLEAAAGPDTVMDSAKYYYNYNDYGGYPNWGYVVFEDEFLGTLVLNCTFPNNDLVLKIGTYSAGNYTQGIDLGLSYYNVVGGNPSSLNYNYTNKMTVDVVDGKYSISLDVKNNNGETLEATYVGDIEGLVYPDLRTPLATPNVTYSVDGKTITLSWTAVTGADSYNVFCASTSDIEPIDTTDTTVEIEAPAYSTAYEFKVTAVALDSNHDYKSSEPEYVTVATERDPNAEVIEFTSLRFVRSETTYNPEYCNVFELTNADNVKMELYVGSYQSSETDIAVGSYHYESKDNLGWSQRQWGFQSKIWVGNEYLGLADQNSIMVVKKSGDVYNIDFTLGLNDATHFFVCNVPIGGDDNTGGEDPNPEQPDQPEPDPDQPEDGDEGGVVLSSCTYKGTYEGLLPHYQLASSDGKHVINVLFHQDCANMGEIELGTFTSDSAMNTYLSNGTKVCVNGLTHTIDGVANCSATTTGSTVVVSQSGTTYTITIELSTTSYGVINYTFVGALS